MEKIMAAKFWMLWTNVAGSNDTQVRYTDHQTAVDMAKLVSANNNNAPVFVMEAMEKVVGDTVTEM